MPSKISFGLLLPSREVVLGLVEVQDVIGMAPKAEGLGYGSLWVGDSLLAKPRLDPLTSLAAIAMMTKEANLGTAILLLALRNPLLLAQQWATLDRMAEGRSILGVGIGGGRYTRELFEKEFSACGVSFRDRAKVMEEAIEMIRLLWGQDKVSYKGRFLSCDDVDLHPKPRGPCPIWIACASSDRGLRRVAQLGDGWIANVLSPEEFEENWRKVRSYARELGRDEGRITPTFYMYLSLDEDGERAWSEADDFLATYYNTRFSRETLERWGSFGPRRLVVERIEKTLEAGARVFILHFASSKPEEQMRRFAKDVMPNF